MLVVMKNDATEEQVHAVIREIKKWVTGVFPCRAPRERQESKYFNLLQEVLS